MADGFRRQVDRRVANKGDQVSFADAHQVLVTMEESLADLNSRLTEPVTMNRFRPNIVLRGGQPFAEDAWRKVAVPKQLYLELVRHCWRCVITTTDQITGERCGNGPLRTLSQPGYRLIRDPVNGKTRPMFGWYAVVRSVAAEESSLSSGDFAFAIDFR